ncbi:retrovirus-related pol polyprotein from transposon TNT 1-94 [Tanacetum coccineum]
MSQVSEVFSNGMGTLGSWQKLPEELGRLECLKELNIAGTSIVHLSRSIYQLKVGYEEPSASEVSAMFANQLKAWKEKRMKDKAALYLLFQSVDESGFEKIVEATTSKEAWETLEKVYKGADRVKQVWLQTLRGELEAMKMKDTKGVSDYITRVQTVSLLEKFKNVVCAIEESKNLVDMKINDLAGSLEAHEQRKIKKKQESFDDQVAKDGANDCYNWGKSGHYARDCRLAKRVEENMNLMIEEEKVYGIVMMVYKDVVEEEANVDDIVMMTYEDDVVTETVWYLDTTASNHMCGDKHLFMEMKDLVDGCVSFSDELKV